ncbi:pseudouridine kinase [Quillaja saponaria]|uniref:Pseudouridine kinase n=1 Tax=Quillaja saponaria TaxID=32244 RepID=A0AAD7M3E3_QUISA|nr:pseudouridine kinase [Quillaja saponaria]
MENSRVRSRIGVLSRHFTLLHEANFDLYTVLLRGVQLKHGDAEIEEAEAVVIGGMVLDVHATPSFPANPRTTTPGKVYYVLGGVARNVAECMSKLGKRPYMISAVGEDMAGNLLMEHWTSAGLSIKGIRKSKGIETAVVCNVFDVKGEVAAGVASMEAIEKFLTPDWIQQNKGSICSAPVLMVDANLNLSALEASCQLAVESRRLVWFEPVSVAKSRKITGVVQYVTFASPNEDELIAMANALSDENVFHPLEKDSRDNYSIVSLLHMLKPAIWVLLEKGIKIVVLTLGSDGVFLCTKGGPSFMRMPLVKTKQHGSLYQTVIQSCPSNLYSVASEANRSSHLFAVHFPSLPASVVRVTGAGDCLVGGTIASICAGLDIMQGVAVGIAAAKAAVEAETNVPFLFSLAAIADDARTVYSAAKVVFHQSML